MPTILLEKQEILGKDFTMVDGIKIRFLPDCPKCGANEWTLTATDEYLKCSCGAKFYNRNRV